DKEEYIPRCPHCNDDITELDAFVLEENKYTVELIRDSLQWSTSDVVESSAVRTVYNCPGCEETLFTVRGGDSDPRIVIDFLKGVKMTWVQDVGIQAMVLDTFNKREPKPPGSYYAEGYPRAGGDIGIYFVDPTSPERGMAPIEEEKAKPLFRKREGRGPI
ncbi:MAG: hypothetical protein KAT53_01695, partial [Dehalococcoidia bacterium]|nr:hypothetical protein [Dehalococcoidia bacterium]